jgi:hypothetical protein
MVNRKDFRPTSQGSVTISDKDRALIKKGYNANYENMTTKEKLAEDKKHSLKIVEKKQQKVTPYTPFEKEKLTESEVNLLTRRINAQTIKASEVEHIKDGTGYDLTEEQSNKGLAYLRNQDKTPKGQEKENSPFRAREQEILYDNSANIRLKDVYSERGNYYYPVYEVNSSKGTFDYYVSGGKVHIIG